MTFLLRLSLMCVKSVCFCAYMFIKMCVCVCYSFCLMSMCDLQVSRRPNLRVRLKIKSLTSPQKHIRAYI